MTKTINFLLCTFVAGCMLSCTLALDTIFSNVPSAHKAMWVYNRSGDGLRCSLRQEKGGSSGFRINIDGIYLGADNNYGTSEIEIRNKDSVQVFVEATLPEASQSTPQKDEDNLIFTLQSGVEQKVNLNAWAWNAKLIKGLVVCHLWRTEGGQQCRANGCRRYNTLFSQRCGYQRVWSLTV